MENFDKNKLPPSKEIAYIAVMCAVLIGGQFALSFIPGVEVVSLLLAAFAFVFGVRCGVLCALGFSLLRNFFFPFSYSALILYVIYYPIFAFVFASLRRIDRSANNFSPCLFLSVNLILGAICITCVLLYAFDVIVLSRIYKVTFFALLWVIFSLFAVFLIAFNVLFILHKIKKFGVVGLKTILFGCVGVCLTICFTLLDDIITPLFYGYTKEAALGYFYVSFTAMLPQIICVFVSIVTLFLPLTRIMKKAKNT